MHLASAHHGAITQIHAQVDGDLAHRQLPLPSNHPERLRPHLHHDRIMLQPLRVFLAFQRRELRIPGVRRDHHGNAADIHVVRKAIRRRTAQTNSGRRRLEELLLTQDHLCGSLVEKDSPVCERPEISEIWLRAAGAIDYQH